MRRVFGAQASSLHCSVSTRGIANRGQYATYIHDCRFIELYCHRYIPRRSCLLEYFFALSSEDLTTAIYLTICRLYARCDAWDLAGSREESRSPGACDLAGSQE